MKRISCLLVLAFLSVALFAAEGLFVQSGLYPETEASSYAAQLRLPETTPTIPLDSVLEALGREDYPVTPGDVYTLRYTDGKEVIELPIQIDTDLEAMVSTFGSVNGTGKTAKEFQKAIEELVLTYNKYALPDVSLTSCGVFSVKVSGEVNYSTYVKVWGLSRLSDLAVLASPYASTRSVMVKSKNGKSSTYDLYKGVVEGSDANNPLLKAGDEIVFAPATTTVTLSGAVKKSGTYQPKKGETLKDLVSSYGAGLLNSASLDSITVSNFENGQFKAKTYKWDEASTCVLKDGDVVFVATSAQALPYVTVEGAIGAGTTADTVSGKLFYNYYPGETAEELLRSISYAFLPTSDTEGIYILRNGQKIALDVDGALTSSGKGSTVLEQGDTIIVPFSQLFVTVNGAVNKPGVFSYVPDRNADYYIALAGGFSDTASPTRSSTVYDKDGTKLKKTNTIPNESTITVAKDAFKANLATTVTVVGLVASVVSIIYNSVMISLEARQL